MIFFMGVRDRRVQGMATRYSHEIPAGRFSNEGREGHEGRKAGGSC